MNESRKKTALLNKKGYGLLEILVASVIMGTILIGGAETLKVALQSQAISGNTIAENDLKVAFSKSVQMDNCAETLRPLNLAGTDDNLKNRGIGKFKDSVPLAGELKSSGLFKDRLQVVKVELKGTEPTHETEPLTPPWTEPKDREYTIYYHKTGMGSLNTMGGGTCSATDISGCYHYSCQVEYERQSASEMSCQAQDCSDLSQVIMSQVQSSITSQIANKKCADNKYFIGFDSTGNPICSAEIHCGEKKTLRVYEEGGVKKAECLPAVTPKTCTEPGEVMIGIDSNGNIICGSGCGAGGREVHERVHYSYVYNGITSTATRVYPLNQTFSSNITVLSREKICKCPDSLNTAPTSYSDRRYYKAYWNNKECVTCLNWPDIRDYTSPRWIQSELKCMTCDEVEHNGEIIGGFGSMLWTDDPDFNDGYKCACILHQFPHKKKKMMALDIFVVTARKVKSQSTVNAYPFVHSRLPLDNQEVSNVFARLKRIMLTTEDVAEIIIIIQTEDVAKQDILTQVVSVARTGGLKTTGNVAHPAIHAYIL